jgi:hypothetical protein
VKPDAGLTDGLDSLQGNLQRQSPSENGRSSTVFLRSKPRGGLIYGSAGVWVEIPAAAAQSRRRTKNKVTMRLGKLLIQD